MFDYALFVLSLFLLKSPSDSNPPSILLITLYVQSFPSRPYPISYLFCFSLVLIAVMGRDGASDDAHMGKLLDNVFHAMVLLYGLDDLVNIKNVERFKKEIRVRDHPFMTFTFRDSRR